MLRLLPPLAATMRHTLATQWRLRGVEGAARWQMQARAQQRGARAVLNGLRVRLVVEGDVPDRPLLIVPNHTSWLDGFVVAAAFSTAIAGRGDVLGWPLFGRVARAMGVVPVYRGRATATADFVRDVQARLAAGVNVLAFAEGTTTRGDALLPFKSGVFEAVAGTPYAVLPVYHQAVRSRHGVVTPETLAPLTWAGEGASLRASVARVVAAAPLVVVVRVGAPIEARGETRKSLARQAQQAVEALRESVQRRAASFG